MTELLYIVGALASIIALGIVLVPPACAAVSRRRLPFRLRLNVKNLDDPSVEVIITNRRSGVPLSIKAARVHFGCREYNNFFILAPYDEATLQPFQSQRFTVPYSNTRVGRIQLIPADAVGKGPKYPTYEDPGFLFRAIANGKPKDIWIEVDYDAVRAKQIRLPGTNRTFKMVSQLRRQKQPEQSPPTYSSKATDGLTGNAEE